MLATAEPCIFFEEALHSIFSRLMSFVEICNVQIPVPVRSRTVTNGDVVKAARVHQGKPVGEDTPTAEEKKVYTVVAVESRRRFGLARTHREEAANYEACILKDALYAMADEMWWKYKYELIDGHMEFLLPFLDALV